MRNNPNEHYSLYDHMDVFGARVRGVFYLYSCLLTFFSYLIERRMIPAHIEQAYRQFWLLKTVINTVDKLVEAFLLAFSGAPWKVPSRQALRFSMAPCIDNNFLFAGSGNALRVSAFPSVSIEG
ncbi:MULTISPECIES: hypothetical protein [Pseudomonadota]|uniref:hypothetical protein n=1 Tax=Pseudomonadota TaxID=1224 RepID=UPI001C07B23B|nr:MULTISPECIES: hypothetical protein [Pseudomonadota]MBU2829561.1 hypothetical protein [Acidithiobacillus ferriphilus]MBU2833052.1 hypothetical protein [Acidithiobacillus ferriphilus]